MELWIWLPTSIIYATRDEGIKRALFHKLKWYFFPPALQTRAKLQRNFDPEQNVGGFDVITERPWT
jgi:hypothetical protein